MFESSRSRLVTGLRNGVVDIAIIPGATALPESKTMSLWSERILVAAPEGHALAERDSAHWIDLREEKILLSRRDLSRFHGCSQRMAGVIPSLR